MAHAEDGGAAAFDVFVRQVGDVDVEEEVARQRVGGKVAVDVERAFYDAVQVLRVVCGAGEGDGGQAEVMAFKGGGDGAGVEDVFAHVGAVVDAGDDHVGPGVDVAGECEVDAVGWCAVHAPDACAVFGDG